MNEQITDRHTLNAALMDLAPEWTINQCCARRSRHYLRNPQETQQWVQAFKAQYEKKGSAK